MIRTYFLANLAMHISPLLCRGELNKLFCLKGETKVSRMQKNLKSSYMH